MTEGRTFIDRSGVRWAVTEVRPAHGAAPLRERRKFPRMEKRGAAQGRDLGTRELALPWLRFDSRADSRSVDPAPAEWRDLSDAELEDLLSRSLRYRGT